MKNSITAIVQARMGSTRLPGKVMLPLDGSPVLEHIIGRIRRSEYVDEIVIATTFHKTDDIIANLASDLDVNVVRGSDDDVLARITQAAHRSSSELIIRVTGDNPFVDPHLLDHISAALLNKHDYVSNKIDRTWPIGIDADGFSVSSLTEASEMTHDPVDREHITSFFIRNQSDYDVKNITIQQVYSEEFDRNVSNIRLTLDEARDYATYENICEYFANPMNVGADELIRYINDNPEQIRNSNVNQRTDY